MAELFEFIYENWVLIKNNWVVFLIFAFLIISIFSSVFGWLLMQQKQKHDRIQKELSIKLEEKDKTISSLKDDIKTKNDTINKLGTEAWSVTPIVGPNESSAKKISEKMQQEARDTTKSNS